MPLFSAPRKSTALSDEDREKLLESPESQDECLPVNEWDRKPKRCTLKMVIPHFAVFLVYTMLFAAAWKLSEKRFRARHVDEPYCRSIVHPVHIEPADKMI